MTTTTERRALRNLPIPDYPIPGPACQARVGFDFDQDRSSEPLVDIADYGVQGERYYSRSDGWNWPYEAAIFPSCVILARRSVAEMLVLANTLLADEGLQLIVLDGLRTLTEQRRLWEHFCSTIEVQHPHLDRENREELAARFCSDPGKFDRSSPATWPVHMTGGSVDATVARLGSRESSFMGSLFDDPADSSHSAYYERQDALEMQLLSQSEKLAARTRRCLWHAMEAVGFVNYAGEWWHFDFGTALWAHSLSLRGSERKAFYGLASSEIEAP